MELSLWAILPPLIAIFLALYTKEVYSALFLSIIVGELILFDGHIINALSGLENLIFSLFSETWILKTLFFSLMVGSIIHLLVHSGAVDSFVVFLIKKHNLIKSKRSALFFGYFIGVVIFLESSITSLLVGTLVKPFSKKYNISAEKLAYLADSTSAPISSLIVFNGWGALLIGLITSELVLINSTQTASEILFLSLPYNFYAIITLIMVFYVVWSDKDFSLMKKAENDMKKNKQNNIINLIKSDRSSIYFFIPLFILLATIPISLWVTGGGSLMKGSGSSAIFHSTFFTLISMAFLYILGKQYTLKNFVNESIKGASTMLPITILLVFAFSVGKVTADLKTGEVIASLLAGNLSTSLVALVVFIISAIVSFSTGTSWGTFSIMMPIAIALSIQLDANLHLVIGAVISGGIFGDHASPISDTSIVSSMASGCDHISHVKTQLPYALLAGGLSALLFLVFGFSK